MPLSLLKKYLPLIELASAVLAAAFWYLVPGIGAWPLLTGAAPLLLRWALTGRPILRTPFNGWLLLFALTALLAVWSAWDREVAWQKFWLIVGALLLFHALTALVRSGRQGQLMAGAFLALTGVAVALFFLATHDWNAYTPKVALLTRIGRLLQAPLPVWGGHRLHPNVAGGMLAVLLPFVVGLAWMARRWSLRLAALAAAGVIGFALLLTQTRGAWLAVALAGGLVLLWHGIGRFFPAWQRPAFALAVGVPALLALGLVWLAPDVVLLAWRMAGADPMRVRLFSDGLLLARDYPLVGAGLGGFMLLHSSYALLIHVGHSVHTHNLFLDVAIEQGLPGLLLLAGVMGGGIGRWWRTPATARSPLEGAAVAALVVLAWHGLFDDVFYGSRALLLLFVPLSFSAAGGLPFRWPALPASRNSVLAAGAALLLGAVLLFGRPLSAVWLANRAAIAQSRAELGVYSWPDWPVQDAVRREIDLSAVVAGYEHALARNPELVSANRRLGQIALSLGQYERARDLLATAHARRPDATTRQLYGEALLVTGDQAGGAALWREVRNTERQLEIRRFWYRYIDEEALAIRIHEALSR